MRKFIILLAMLPLSACVSTIVGATVDAAVGVTGAVAGAAVKATGAVAGAAVHAVTPHGHHDRNRDHNVDDGDGR